jgi:hypothetical protein
MVKLISVNVNGDTTVEPDEDFRVTLSNPDPIGTGANSTSATIINDDSNVYLPLIMK